MTAFKRDLELIIEEVGFVTDPIVFNVKKLSRIGDKGIEELDINPRAYNGLKRNRINTINDVVDRWDSLNNLKSIGVGTIKVIKNAVLSCYYDRLDSKERVQFWRDAFGC